MAETVYLDFDLSLERMATGKYRARVLNSPAGSAKIEFELPFSDLELENFLLRIGRTRRGVRRLESPEMEATKMFGGRLFKAVFDDEVQTCLRNSLETAKQKGAGLRIRLRLTYAPDLVDLPWEFLYNASLNRFLSLSVNTPIIRYLHHDRSGSRHFRSDFSGWFVRPHPVRGSLRCVVVEIFPTRHSAGK
jgi:hypothetical protein